MARRVLYGATKSKGVYTSNKSTTATVRSPGSDYTVSLTPGYQDYPKTSIAVKDGWKIWKSRKSKLLKETLEKGYSDILNGYRSTSMDTLNRSVGIYEDTPLNLFRMSTKFYNRFKLQQPDQILQRGYPHVFFVRPQCNILAGSPSAPKLVTGISNNSFFNYMEKSCPEALGQLTESFGNSESDFMLALSNNACSFSLTDDFIGNDTYGKTYSGYKIAYGKNNIESKTAGSFTINFNDYRNLHIYQIHKAWLEYISGCYRGELTPDPNTILSKVLDYTSAVYYIITAENGEDIIFWTKYYGVFPTNVPLAQYTWAQENTIRDPEIDITYQYSFKEDYDPLVLTEFNLNSHITSAVQYEANWKKDLITGAKTWVGPPFIEQINESNDWVGPLYYKLRFKKTDSIK